jgi:hypothetical protein
VRKSRRMPDPKSPTARWILWRCRLLRLVVIPEHASIVGDLFNPGIVAHPDPSGAPEGRQRFIRSLRAVGEGRATLRNAEWLKPMEAPD